MKDHLARLSSRTFARWLAASILPAYVLALYAPAATLAATEATPPALSPAQSCEALASATARWQVPTLRVLSAVAHPDGTTVDLGFGGMKSAPLPAHCEVIGVMNERSGRDGAHYAIQVHVRLPAAWNGRFLFQGGGGTDGNLGDATGMTGIGRPPALAQGYAVVSGDSGHSNATNNDPRMGGMVSFGRDAQARADYGHAALKATYEAARAVIRQYYSRPPRHSYFVGCSKGGQEGLAFAERYPDAFDGIIAGDPGMSLPKAALGHAWVAQVFGAVAGADKDHGITARQLQESFSDADLQLARQAILRACDADDGLADGMVNATAQCTTAKVIPQLRSLQCKAGKEAGCLTSGQVAALGKFQAGPTDSTGKSLYASFPWDAGMVDTGWRIWTIGLLPGTPNPMFGPSPDGVPSIAVTMGAGALAEIFTTPPKVLPPDPQAAIDYLLHFDFDKDAPAVFATDADFPRSAWEDISARSPDLSGFHRHGGKMIVYHGASDPVFSLDDTVSWWNEVNERMHGRADETARLFVVPGMAHCAGGPATSNFDAFAALVSWVEAGQKPERLLATAGPDTPWPGRTRPLCSYPAIARYKGTGDPERAENFACALPGVDGAR